MARHAEPRGQVRVALSVAVWAAIAAPGCARESNLPPPAPEVRPAADPGAEASRAPKAPATIVALYDRSCEGGSATGCNNLGIVYLEGQHGTKVDRARADALFQRACDLGSPAGCGNLGFLVRADDPVRAIGLLTRACDGSFWEGCYWLADVYSDGDHEDLPQAVAVLDRACKAGHEKSCGSEAVFYQTGKGVPANPKKASALYERACNADVAFACTGLGSLLVWDDKAAVDVERARAALEKGCTDAYPQGCFAFGIACASGRLGTDWVARADALLQRACALGHADACALLAKRMEDQSSGP